MDDTSVVSDTKTYQKKPINIENPTPPTLSPATHLSVVKNNLCMITKHLNHLILLSQKTLTPPPLAINKDREKEEEEKTLM